MTIDKLQQFVQAFQERRAQVTDDLVKAFMDPTRAIDPAMRPCAAASPAAAA